ncbi:MAG: hypothetical protein Tsb0020_31520 [Haliangiales bacterium]
MERDRVAAVSARDLVGRGPSAARARGLCRLAVGAPRGLGARVTEADDAAIKYPRRAAHSVDSGSTISTNRHLGVFEAGTHESEPSNVS